MKIAVLGYSGAGKSTLARQMSRRLAIPCLHLDRVHWLPGWVERNREESRQMVQDFLDRNSSWVIDGSYPALCCEQRLEQADRIVILALPRLQCLWRAWRRSVQYRGRARADMTEGCPEKFDREFLRWLLWEGRSKARREVFRDISRRWPEKTVFCRSSRQAAALTEQLAGNGPIE